MAKLGKSTINYFFADNGEEINSGDHISFIYGIEEYEGIFEFITDSDFGTVIMASKVNCPNLSDLKDVKKKAKKWNGVVKVINLSDGYNFLADDFVLSNRNTVKFFLNGNPIRSITNLTYTVSDWISK